MWSIAHICPPGNISIIQVQISLIGAYVLFVSPIEIYGSNKEAGVDLAFMILYASDFCMKHNKTA